MVRALYNTPFNGARANRRDRVTGRGRAARGEGAALAGGVPGVPRGGGAGGRVRALSAVRA